MNSTVFSEDMSIVREFVAECNDMIADVEHKILQLSEVIRQKNMPNLEDINAIFRLFHTIKGTSGFLNLSVMQELTHEAETLLDSIRKGEKPLTERYLETFIGAIDFLKSMLPDIENTGSDAAFADQVEDQIMLILSADFEEEEHSAPQAVITPKPSELVFGNFKTEALTTAEKLKSELQNLLNNPTSSDLNTNCLKLSGDLFNNFKLKEMPDYIRLSELLIDYLTHTLNNEFKIHSEDLGVIIQISDVLIEAIALESAKITGAFGMADFLSDIIKLNMAAYQVKEPAAKTVVKAETAEPVLVQAVEKVEKKETVGDTFIRVDLDKIDKLIDWIGELSIAEMMLINNPDLKNSALSLTSFENSAHNVNRILSEIQYLSMSLRMVPIRGSFNKMSRLVHDLTGKFKKEIRFSTEGEETEIDKNVAEQIIDPLMHMVRNSFDHGIEDAAEREAKGKPAAGTITLSARHVGGEIWISIADDGKGLDKEKILAKAVKNGLTDSERIKHLTDEEIYAFIFQAGFSTAETVSALSGRGVGMDVVKRNIDSIKGQISIQSKAGQGSLFILKIPLTMAIIEALLIRVGENRYTIPLAGVTECSRAEESEITVSPSGEEFVKIRNSMIQIVRLHRLFGANADSEQLHEGILMTIKNGSEIFCLFVDEIMEQLQAIVKPLPEDLGTIRGLSGCTILGDGSISPIVDITGILALNREKCS